MTAPTAPTAPTRPAEVREIEAARARALRARRREKPMPPDDDRHGTPEGYTNWMCHCPRCTEAARIARRPVVQRRYKPLVFFPDAAPVAETDAQEDAAEAC